MTFEPDPTRPSQKRAFFGLNCEFHDSHIFDELLKQQNDPLKRENVNVDMNYTVFLLLSYPCGARESSKKIKKINLFSTLLVERPHLGWSPFSLALTYCGTNLIKWLLK